MNHAIHQIQQQLHHNHHAHHPPLPQTGQSNTSDNDGSQADDQASEASNQDEDSPRNSRQERLRIRANWDPSYPGEDVSWYDEFIHRHAPTVVNWFEPARRKDINDRSVNIDARGVALYRPDNALGDPAGDNTLLAISPLDDGGICIWDVNGTRGKKGSIWAQSKPGLLFVDGPQGDNSRASKRVDSGVTECVSVDHQRHRAFFAVQSHLIDVDLQTLSVVGCESFPWSITALSPANATVPLTIATSLGIHLHDYKSRPNTPTDHTERVDTFSSVGAQFFYEQGLRNLFTDVPLPPYAPLAQPGPLSILHLQEPGSLSDLSDDIYVAGRFSHILHYDRRTFPTMKDSIYSGGSLCSMTSSPYPFSALCSERRRQGQMSLDDIANSKSIPGGRTLIACGEYSSKGTLEIYGLSPNPDLSGKMEIAGHQNRYTASGSKLLSVVNHGARIAVSDANGYIKWFERDGFTEIRRVKIGHCEGRRSTGQGTDEEPSVFARSALDDIARKILPTGPVEGAGDRRNVNDLLFWTGDKLGTVGFSTQQGTVPEDFCGEEGAVDRERAEREERYAELVRTALVRHAEEARWLDGGMRSD
ncbi:hypothetical protein GE09DRAFT_946391 [Coniochaeta sp. 2T2.1]|nr:hypothetical protein GE09DRAFT_946391 [Coniochaeta sp. 2T2.1]